MNCQRLTATLEIPTCPKEQEAGGGSVGNEVEPEEKWSNVLVFAFLAYHLTVIDNKFSKIFGCVLYVIVIGKCVFISTPEIFLHSLLRGTERVTEWASGSSTQSTHYSGIMGSKA